MRHPGTRRQGELPELEEILSSDVVFWDGGPRAPPTLQPQPDPDAYRDLEAQRTLSPSLLSNHAGSRYSTGSRAGTVPQPVLVQHCRRVASRDPAWLGNWLGLRAFHREL